MKDEWQQIYSKRGRYFVRISGKAAREDFVIFLEKNGFTCAENESRNRESTIDSRFPLTVDLGRKEYGHIGNTTCAAAAAASGKLITVKEFMSLYEIVNPVVIVLGAGAGVSFGGGLENSPFNGLFHRRGLISPNNVSMSFLY